MVTRLMHAHVTTLTFYCVDTLMLTWQSSAAEGMHDHHPSRFEALDTHTRALTKPTRNGDELMV